MGSDVIWGRMVPGDRAMRLGDPGLDPDAEGGVPGEHHEVGVLAGGSITPDWIGLPPEVGGGQYRVRAVFYASCPLCGPQGVEHDAQQLVVWADDRDRLYGLSRCVPSGTWAVYDAEHLRAAVLS